MMRAKTEELLYYLLWFSDKLMSPTFRNLTDSFEMWAYRNGLLQRLRRLEAQQLVERMRGPATKRIYRLSKKAWEKRKSVFAQTRKHAEALRIDPTNK